MTIFFSPIGSGLGDVVVSLPILRQLVDSNESTYLVARSPRQEGLESLIPGLKGTIPLPKFQAAACTKADKIFDFRSHPLQTDHIWGTPQFEQRFPNIRINDILNMVCKDFGLSVEFSRLPVIPCRQRAEFNDRIVLIPGTVTNTKSWPVSNWMELISMLNGQGQSTVILGQSNRSSVVAELVASGYAWVETPTVEDAAEVITAARAVISVDTGLMHLAVNQARPTIALFESNPIYYRPYSSCLPLFASTCQPACLEALQCFSNSAADRSNWSWYHGQFDTCKVAEKNRCMSSISVNDVLESLQKVLNN